MKRDCVHKGFTMLIYKISFIFAINACFTAAQPTTTALPEIDTPATLTPTRHRGQNPTNSTTMNCSSCGEDTDTVICGTDGMTYINECQFNCAKLENSNLDIKYSVCIGDLEKCTCINDISQPQVCGTDGKTYDTICKMWCENWIVGYGSTVQVAHNGSCEDPIMHSTESNKPAHYKDTATRYNSASNLYNHAATRYNDAATLYNDAMSRYAEKATHYNDAKLRHNYPKTRNEANENIHEATHFIEEATRHIDEATRFISQAVERIDFASLYLEGFVTKT